MVIGQGGGRLCSLAIYRVAPGLLSLSVDEGGGLLCGIDAFMGLALQLMALLADGDWSASFRVMGVGEGLEAL